MKQRGVPRDVHRTLRGRTDGVRMQPVEKPNKKATLLVAFLFGDPTGIRTPVTAVKGRCPRPLDDGVRETYQQRKPDATTDKHRYTQMKIKNQMRVTLNSSRSYPCSSVFICGFDRV